MKKSVKNFGVDTISKDIVSKKKRKEDVLRDEFKANDITESNSVNIKEKFLVKKTSVDYEKGEDLRLITKKALGKPLDKINFLDNSTNNDILLNNSVTTEKTNNAKILVNTNLKKSVKCSNQTMVVKKIPVGMLAKAVCAQKAVVEFKHSDYANLVMLFYMLSVDTNAHNIWDFIRSVNGKTYIINYYPAIYASARCITICFDFANFLDAVIEITPVLRNVNLHWFCLNSAKCAKCKKFEIKPISLVSMDLNNRFVTLEHSFVSLTEHINKLAKRLDTSVLIISQSSLECQLLVTLSLQNQGIDIVISKDSSVATSSGTNMGAVVFDQLTISKLEITLNNLLVTVIDLIAKVNNAGLIPVVCSP
ncbi:hypothetical protein G9A89_012479 [Geosiphon pyriformis]|nr:hypothetical protein G9A89_012479 [Geosiphon pyriformis]